VTKGDLVRALAAYRRPGSPNYAYHFQRLPAEVTRKGNVRALLSVLRDPDAPPRAREHAAGALGEIGDPRAVPALIDALRETELRRGAATALGRMKAVEAADALREIAPRVKAAQWALSQLDWATTPEEIIEDLATCQLRAIRAKVEALDPEQAEAVARDVCRRLREVVAAEEHLSPHRWMITTLQYLAPPEAAAPLIEGLRQYIRRRDVCLHARDQPMICACVPSRLMRALDHIRPVEAIPVLVDFIEEVDNPIHRQMAASCIEKIVREHGDPAVVAVSGEAPRLASSLQSLEQELALTPPGDPDGPRHDALGSSIWQKRMAKATKAIRRVLACAGQGV